jgi:glycosyltransferase involved in cell wall biosynthesis
MSTQAGWTCARGSALTATSAEETFYVTSFHGVLFIMNKPRVLIVYHTYLPSEFAMGPVSAIRHLAECMGHDYEIRLLTLNHDFVTGEKLFSADHQVASTDGASIEYLPRGFRGLRILWQRLREPHEVLEIHSGFDRHLAIPALVLTRMGIVNGTRAFHSPHGIFLPIDMSRGAFKKRLYCALADVFNLYKNVVHLASSPGEVADIRRWHRRTQRIVEMPHFVDAQLGTNRVAPRSKRPQSLKIAFVGRIALQKNFMFAIEVVRALGVESQMDVFGEADPDYWPACDAALNAGTGLCKVNLHGHVPQTRLLDILPNYDVLLHPTSGENFGYSIIEALGLGVPVLLSDKSPWLDIEKVGAGWVVPLSDHGAFVARLTEIFNMGTEWQSLRESALNYAREKIENERSRKLRASLYSGESKP